MNNNKYQYLFFFLREKKYQYLMIVEFMKKFTIYAVT